MSIEQNNTNFPIEITKKYTKYKIPHNAEIKKFPSGISNSIDLFSYQKFIEDYLGPDNNYRGLLLYFGLGSGKSITAINVAEKSKRRVVIMLPRALRDNFIEEIITFTPEFSRPKDFAKLDDKEQRKIQMNIEKKIRERYTFVSSNAGNSAEKLVEFGLSDAELQDFSKYNKTLDNTLLIIDEVHTLVSNMINPDAKNGTKIFHMIMNAKNIKLLFLSGTPIVGDPFEVGLLFNMLRGYITIPSMPKEKFTAMPENYDIFHEYFVNEKENKIKNKEVFQERIVGLVSYYQGARESDKRNVYPEKLKTRKIAVRMSDYQWKLYVKQRRIELDEERKIKFSKKQFVKLINKKPARSMATTFSVGTRQLSNFALPEGIEKPKRKGAEEAIDLSKTLKEIPKEALTTELGKYSPKMKLMFDKIKELDEKSLVYSEFISLEGIGIFARVLEENGYKNFEKKEDNEESSSKQLKKSSSKQLKKSSSNQLKKSSKENKENKENKNHINSFAIFSGKTPDYMRRKILHTFNAKDNLRGEKLKLILFTASGAQGLNTKGVRNVFMMEPYWHNNRIEQIIGRAVRTHSHADLPRNEREVQPFIFLSVPPVGANIEVALGEQATVDQRIYMRAMRKQELIDSFLLAIREMAVDCQLNHEHNKESVETCRICVPTGKKMYPLRVENHLLPGGRTCFSEKKEMKKKLKTVEIDGRILKQDTDGKLYEEVDGQKGVYVEVVA